MMEPNIREALSVLVEAVANDTLPTTEYYTTEEDAVRGSALLVPAWSGLPRFLIIHPDDFDVLRHSLPRYVVLVHFRDWRPS